MRSLSLSLAHTACAHSLSLSLVLGFVFSNSGAARWFAFTLKIDTQMCFNGRFLLAFSFRLVLRIASQSLRFVMPSVVFLCD